MPDLTELCAALGPDLVPVPGSVVEPVPVTAVHVSELTDPTPFLEGGELLLTTGMALRPPAPDVIAYVARLVEAGVAALALSPGPVLDDLPDGLIRTCRERGLPLLTVPPPTPFLRIARTYWGLLARSGEERLTASLGAHRALVRAAAGPDPVRATVLRLAGAIDGWAALLSGEGDVRAIWPQAQQPQARQAATEIGRLRVAGPHSSATFPLGVDDVVLYPLSTGSRLTGFVTAGCRRPMRTADRQIILTAAALLALQSAQERQAVAGQHRIHAAVTSLILDGDVEAARRLMLEFAVPVLGDSVQVLTLQTSAELGVGEIGDAASRLLLRVEQPALAARRGPVVVMLLAEGVGSEQLTMFHRWLTEADPESRVHLSGPVEPAQVSGVQRGLRRAVTRLDPGALRRPATGGAADPTEGTDLQPLMNYTRSDLVSAVTAYLRARGRWEEAARALGVHRNTLRHRIGTAGRVMGVDLDDPDVAADLWLALRRQGLS